MRKELDWGIGDAQGGRKGAICSDGLYGVVVGVFFSIFFIFGGWLRWCVLCGLRSREGKFIRRASEVHPLRYKVQTIYTYRTDIYAVKITFDPCKEIKGTVNCK